MKLIPKIAACFHSRVLAYFASDPFTAAAIFFLLTCYRVSAPWFVGCYTRSGKIRSGSRAYLVLPVLLMIRDGLP
ncbi:hypothetical protein O9992_02035 [Vibrio lentus]|nr:hypothetical protein [Vibrio lentus]